MPATRFSEIHYDNTGADVGEAIEISGPAGTDVTGWKIGSEFVVGYVPTGKAPRGWQKVAESGADLPAGLRRMALERLEALRR